MPRGYHRFKEEPVNRDVGIVERGEVDLPVPALEEFVVDRELFGEIVREENARP